MFPLDSGTVLVVGAGGGGDIVTASVFGYKLRRLGFEAYIAAPPWERMVVDPVPGPIALDEVYGYLESGENYKVIDGSSYALRNGNRVVFQAANVSAALGEPIYIYSLSNGVVGASRGLLEICDRLDIDLVVAVDVGGDILALGDEDELWSPLADQVTLASLNTIWRDRGIDVVLAVAAPGADGELDKEYVLGRVNEVSRLGGYIGAMGFDKSDIPIFRRILSKAVSEAGQVILDALEGYVGWKVIRKGTRRVYVDVVSTLVFLMDANTVFNMSPMAQKLVSTSSIDEANEILIGMGVPTEYELEIEASKLARERGGNGVDSELINMARLNVLSKVRRRRQQ